MKQSHFIPGELIDIEYLYDQTAWQGLHIRIQAVLEG